MADREIRLIGSFRDDISPKLNKLNRQLLGTVKQFEKLQNKIAPVAAEMAKFNTAAAATSGNLKTQRSAIEENIRMLRQYRTELSRTANAQSRMGGGGAPRPPRGGGGGGGSPIPPRAGGGGTPSRGGGGGGGYDGGGIGAGVFGVTLGTQLGNMMTSAIIAGFQTGTQIMMAPFKFGAQAIGERIRDEMSDVRTAGGLFAISKRMEKPIFGNFAEAENYTKEQNRYLAKLAGSLPGDTQEYIQVSKQIADGIFTVVSQDAKNAQKLAQTLATTRGASAAEIAKLSGSGTTAMQQTGKELVGEMTKLTVLAGLGGRQGAFGLPQLTERMIAEQKISMGMFQRYAAIFRDPMIKGALERNIKNINATGKNTAARLEALQKTFQEIVTPELVRRYQRTTAGVLEALKTAFLNPEVGLLGLGRPLGAAVTRFDEFGRAMGEIGGKMVPLVNTFEKNGKLYGYTIDKQGRATRQLVEVATEQISIFDSLRDVFANVMIVLQPIIDNIALIFDPLANLGGILSRFRDATMKFQSAFERYREFLVGAAKDIADEKTRLQFTATIPLRASLQTINDALRAYGGYAGDAMAEFNRVSALLANPATGMEEMGRILKGMIEKFLSSEFAAKIGSGIGTVIGTVLSEVANMMKAAAGLATGGKLAEGFSAGFKAAGGPQAFSDIIKSVFHIFGKLLLEIVKAAPLEAAIVAALFFLPGAIAGLVSQALSGGFTRGLGGGGGRRGGGGLSGGGSRGRYGTGGSIDRLNRRRRGRMASAAEPWMNFAATSRAGQGAIRAFGKANNAMGVVIRGVGKVGKFVPGGAMVAGAFDLASGLASGEPVGKAIATAFGSVLGGTIGTVFGPAGTVIGSIAGGALADFAYNALDPSARQQQQAAQLQMEAAQRQAQRSGIQALTAETGAAPAEFLYGSVDEFRKRLDFAGYANDKSAQSLIKEYTERNVALEELKQTNAKLSEFKSTLAATATPSQVQVQRLKELNGAVATAKVVYDREQKQLAAKFGQTPQKITDAIVSSINAKMSTVQIDAAIAARIRGAEYVRGIEARMNRPGGSPGGVQTDQEASSAKSYGRYYSGNNAWRGSLGQAISSEMRNKPAGSDLVIANSSERVIPAYKGYSPASLYASSAADSFSGRGNMMMSGITINVNGTNAKEIADEVANELLVAMYRKSRSEVLTS